MQKMFFRDQNTIEFGESYKSLVAISEVGRDVYIGFAWQEGQSPTNAFEWLAQFVWSERYPTKPFKNFRWYDFQRPYSSMGGNADDETAFKILPVELDGYALQKKLGGLLGQVKSTEVAKEGDAKVIESSPIWKSEVLFSSLPIDFQIEVRKHLINPARSLNLI